MANQDIRSDVTPLLPFARPRKTDISAMRTAIGASGVSASYPSSFLDTATRNDLIYICRANSIAVAGL